MAARLRGPGLTRAGWFTLLGVLFSAVLVTVIRLAYGFSNPFDGSDGWDAKWQNAVLIVALLGAPLFFLVGLGAFLRFLAATLRAGWPVLKNPKNRHRAVALSPEEFDRAKQKLLA